MTLSPSVSRERVIDLLEMIEVDSITSAALFAIAVSQGDLLFEL